MGGMAGEEHSESTLFLVLFTGEFLSDSIIYRFALIFLKTSGSTFMTVVDYFVFFGIITEVLRAALKETFRFLTAAGENKDYLTMLVVTLRFWALSC
jgi:hypothetical protein